MAEPTTKVLEEFERSLKKYPAILPRNARSLPATAMNPDATSCRD
jgi:hypothetical protein